MRFYGVTFATLILLCGAAQSATFIDLRSEPGDPLLQGAHLRLIPADGRLDADYSSFDGSIHVSFYDGEADDWRLVFLPPAEALPLAPGLYENTHGNDDPVGLRPGLRVSNGSRSCHATGRFSLLEVEYADFGKVSRLAAEFELRCEGNQAVLRGSVRFNSNVPETAPTPTAAPATPNPDAATTYLHLNSDHGDPAGGGKRQTLTLFDGSFVVTSSFNGVDVLFRGEENWVANFSAPEGEVLQPRVYENAVWPSSPLLPSLLVRAVASGPCRPIGKFTVLELAYGVDSQIRRFAADFEQHCDGAPPALFGSIRFHSMLPTPPLPTITPTPDPVSSFISLQGDPGERITNGASYLLEPRDGDLYANYDERSLKIEFGRAGEANRWHIELAAPLGQALQPGIYENTRDSHSLDHPLLRVESATRRCSDAGGRFEIKELVYSPAGLVRHLAVDLQQRCGTEPMLLRGVIRLHSLVPSPTLPPSPTATVAMSPTKTPSATNTPSITVTTTPSRTRTPCPSTFLDGQLPLIITSDTSNASNLNTSGCGGEVAAEQAFRFIPPRTGVYTFSTDGSSFDTVLYIRPGACAGDSTYCNDDYQTGMKSSRLTVSLEGGVQTFVFVDGFGGQSGPFTLRISEGTDGALCASETLAVAWIVSGDTRGRPDLQSSTCGGRGAGDQTFAFTAGEAGVYSFSTAGSELDTVLSLRDSNCLFTLACNDDAPIGAGTSEIQIALDAAQTVAVTVDGFGSSEGSFKLWAQRLGDIACSDVTLSGPLPISVTASDSVNPRRFDQCGAGAEKAFAFTVPADGDYLFQIDDANVSPSLYLLDADSCAPTEFSCSYPDRFLGSRLSARLTAGRRVAIVVDGLPPSGSRFRLRVEQLIPTPTASPSATAAPDACPEVDLGNELPIIIDGTSTGGRDDLVAPCGNAGVERTFLFTAPSEGEYYFSTYDTNSLHSLYLLDGTCTGALLRCTSGSDSRLDRIHLRSGQRVVVVVDGSVGKFGLRIESFARTPTPTAPPLRPCPDAFLASTVPQSIATNTFPVAGQDSLGSCGGYGEERSFRFEAPIAGLYSFKVKGGQFAVLYLRDGACTGPEIACDATNDIELIRPLPAGRVVFVFVDSRFPQANEELRLEIDRVEASPTPTPTPPPCPNGTISARVLSQTNGSHSHAAGSCGGGDAPERVFAFTASETGHYAFDTNFSGFDTVLYVRDGGCDGVELACNDDSGGTDWSRVRVGLTAGQRVMVFADGFVSRSGQFQLHANRVGSPCLFDCNADQTTTIEDVIALIDEDDGTNSLSCSVGNPTPSTIDEIRSAVAAAQQVLTGCESD